MPDDLYEFGIGDGDEEMLEQPPPRGFCTPRRSRRRERGGRKTIPGSGRFHDSKINKRRRLRTDEMLQKLEGLAHSGTVVLYEGSVPCVAVRLDELLATVEWVRELREGVEVMRNDQRRLTRQLTERSNGDK